MTATNFPQSLSYVLENEGGYVNHPADPGGATNKGVTQAVYDDWRAARGIMKQSVRLIAPPEVSAIYRKQYWDAVSGDKLPSGLDYAVFDFAVNSGVNRAARYLQKCLGFATQDGKIGPQTLGAIKDPGALIDALCDRRRAFLQQLPTFGHFGKGWMRRVDQVEARAKGMVA